MKKQEFVKLMAEKAEISQASVKAFFDIFEEAIGEVVAARDEVTIAGIKIATKEVAAQTRVHNFGEKAGESYVVPAKISPVVKFTPSKKSELSVEI